MIASLALVVLGAVVGVFIERAIYNRARRRMLIGRRLSPQIEREIRRQQAAAARGEYTYPPREGEP